MKNIAFRAAGIALVVIGVGSSSMGEAGTTQKLAVAAIDAVKESGAMDFEIVVTLRNGSKASVLMNAFTVQTSLNGSTGLSSPTTNNKRRRIGHGCACRHPFTSCWC